VGVSIPTDKDDLESVNSLESYIDSNGYDAALIDAIPALLNWVVDLHWQITQPLARLLAGAGNVLVPHIRQALEADDDDAKFALIKSLLPWVERAALALLADDLQRIASASDSGAADAARDLLAEAKLLELH